MSPTLSRSYTPLWLLPLLLLLFHRRQFPNRTTAEQLHQPCHTAAGSCHQGGCRSKSLSVPCVSDAGEPTAEALLGDRSDAAAPAAGAIAAATSADLLSIRADYVLSGDISPGIVTACMFRL